MKFGKYSESVDCGYLIITLFTDFDLNLNILRFKIKISKRQIDNGDNDGVLDSVQEKKWAQKTGIWVYIYIYICKKAENLTDD